MVGTPRPGLVGRITECHRLDGLLARVRAGGSEVLVIRGEAGIGKTALVRYAARQASGFRVVQLTGVEAEMELPFAGVHQLCATIPDRLDALPPPQRHALSVALGLVAGEVPERFLVGLAVLSLLSAVADERPLLCLVEDAQWLDAASSQILGLVARRVRAESVAVVVAVREPVAEHDFDGLPELRLAGLPEQDARVLLANVVAGRLDSRVVDRIIVETRGNPLALLELPARMTAAELAGGFRLPAAGELPTHIEDHYLRRVRELPEDTQQLMLLAAAEPLGDPSLVLRAGRRLKIETSALAPAELAELLEIGARVQFRHPLVRSAVYRAAPLVSRRRVHEVLAEVSEPDDDADRRAWHRALAAAEPDEDVGAELERSAGRAQARGGFAATAAFLQRAATLTPDPARRSGRALAAARASVQAGAFTTARGLLAAAQAGPLDELQRAQTDLVRAQLAFVSSRGTDATPLLLAAARRLEPLDISTARETYIDAFSAALFGARLNGSVGVREVAEAARAAPRPPDAEPATADPLLDALVALADDYASAVPLCREAVQRLSGENASAISDEPLTCRTSASGPLDASAGVESMFNCVFGRDALRMAFDLLDDFPNVARATLLELARQQGLSENQRSEEEPGRILHESRQPDDPIRVKASAVWDFPHYGTVDATPQWVNLLSAYCNGHDPDFLAQPILGRAAAATMGDCLVAAVDWLLSTTPWSHPGLPMGAPHYSQRHDQPILDG